MFTAVANLQPPTSHSPQGLHDIGTVLHLVVGPQRALPMLTALVRNQLAGYVQRDMAAPMAVTQLLLPLIRLHDPALWEHLTATQVQPFFALPWLLTWFAHVL